MSSGAAASSSRSTSGTETGSAPSSTWLAERSSSASTLSGSSYMRA
jgi:hypothetical protein